MRAFSCLFGAIMIALPASTAAAWSQDPPEPAVIVTPDLEDEPTSLDDVVVERRSIEAQAERYVEEASRPVGGRGLARWQGAVCVGVVNFRREAAQQIADGLAHAGGELGVSIADGDCEPNILIIGAVDAREVASGWVEREYREFRPNIADATLSRERLTEFTTADVPVRWWAISRPSYFDIFAGRALLMNGPRSSGRINIYSRSQKESHTRDDLQRLIIIMDVGQVEGTSFENLIAYLTLVAFTQIDMRADMRDFDTVLNLFNEGYAGAGLTSWDRAYIQALYAMPRDLRINTDQQARGVASQIREGAEVP